MTGKTDQNRPAAGTVRIDTDLPYEELLMTASAQMPSFEANPQAPAGYRWVCPDEVPALKQEWAALLKDLCFVDSQPQGEAIFEAMKEQDPTFFCEHLYALQSLEDGHLACSAGLWPGRQFTQGIRLHWVMSDPRDQGRGLARAVLQKAIAAWQTEKPAERLYLSTQAGSWAAIRLYESLGFLPYEGVSQSASAEQNAQRWQKARQSIEQKYDLKV